MAKEFVREGLKFDGKNDWFYLTDYFAVLHYYKSLKENGDTTPSLIPKNDFSEIPEAVAEEVDYIIDQLLIEIEELETTSGDPMSMVFAGDVNMFGFIMHDPLLKQAIGNVAIEIFMRDAKITEDEAYERAKEELPDFMADFEGFLNEVASYSFREITRKAANHGISITDVRELLSPKVAKIGWSGIKLQFTQPFSGSKKRTKKSKNGNENMFV
jgi:hypothetical protein